MDTNSAQFEKDTRPESELDWCIWSRTTKAIAMEGKKRKEKKIHNNRSISHLSRKRSEDEEEEMAIGELGFWAVNFDGKTRELGFLVSLESQREREREFSGFVSRDLSRTVLFVCTKN